MKTYVLGAGASLHAGYPLTRDMGTKLLVWMQQHDDIRIRDAAAYFQAEFHPINDIEDLFSRIQEAIDGFENGTDGERSLRTVIGNQRPYLVEGLRAWFSEIRGSEAAAYRQFASDIVKSGDCIITFNYDVSLDRELRRAGKWEVGTGYGFVIEGLPANAPTALLKLHGSTNWLAILFGGRTRGPFQVQGAALGTRPVIASAEFDFLGYNGLSDPLFSGPSAAVSPMILPTRSKKFYFDTSFGNEWEDFWNDLWEQARQYLQGSDEIFILGYSLAAVDERACDLLFSGPSRDARIEVASGSHTGDIVGRFRQCGFSNVVEARETYFERWVVARR